MRERRTHGHRFCDRCGGSAVRSNGRARLLEVRDGEAILEYNPESTAGMAVEMFSCLDCWPRERWFEKAAEPDGIDENTRPRSPSFGEGIAKAVARYG